MTELQKMGAAAKKAAAVLRTAGEKKRTALNAAAAALRARQAEILADVFISPLSFPPFFLSKFVFVISSKSAVDKSRAGSIKLF